MAQKLSYIRVKRRHQTVFLLCEPSQSFATIRSKVGQILDIDPTELALVAPDRETEYPDEAVLSDHKLMDDTVLFALKRQGGGLETIELLDAAPE